MSTLSPSSLKTIDFSFNLEELGAINYIYIRYKASTSGWWIFSSSDDWVTDKAEYEVEFMVC